MTLHRNARTCPRSRRLLADRVLVESWSLAAAAEAAGVSERTAWKWVDRYRREGEAGLEDFLIVQVGGAGVHHVGHLSEAGHAAGSAAGVGELFEHAGRIRKDTGREALAHGWLDRGSRG